VILVGFNLAKDTTRMPVYVVLILVIAGFLILGGKLFYVSNIPVEELENSLIVSRLLYSDDCLSGGNGELDVSRFSEDHIHSCLNLGEDYGIKLSYYFLDDNSTKEVIEVDKYLTSRCSLGLNEDDYVCHYSEHYFTDGGKGGILSILISNEN